MAKKHKLNFTPEYNFVLVGISSHENDYRLSWAINTALGLELAKTENLVILSKTSTVKAAFSRFTYLDQESMTTYNLISNRSHDAYYIEELRTMDYFLIVDGENDESGRAALLKKVKSIGIVHAAFSLEPASLKSKANLILP